MEGGVERERCLPSAAGGVDETPLSSVAAFYSDATCTQTFPLSGTRYVLTSSQSTGLPTAYFKDVDASGNITAIYPATHTTTYAYQKSVYGCTMWQGGSQVMHWYTLGAAIPMTEFVELTTVTQ